jgi:hypothetical protein
MNSSSPFVFPPVAKQPKSPKSPKAALENPLLKSSSLFLTAPSLVPEHERSPEPVVPNRSQKLAHATPGPPPRASMSLNLKLGSVSEVCNPTGTVSSSILTSNDDLTPFKEKSTFHDNTKSSVPVPISSPQSLFGSRETPPKDRALVNRGSGHGHWVVAFGYTNDKESKELYSILQEYGRILSTKSSGNWIAVQFQDEVSAQQASARQLVRVGSILFGISRTNAQLLQELGSKQSAEKSDLQFNTRPSNASFFAEKSSQLEEEDILAGYAKEESEISSARHYEKSVCEKMFYWYFGWDTSVSKSHSD